jgi:hypothetical protein
VNAGRWYRSKPLGVQYLLCCATFVAGFVLLGGFSGDFRLTTLAGWGALVRWAATWSLLYGAIWWLVDYLVALLPAGRIGRAKAVVRLAAEANAGSLSGLRCPVCRRPSVGVWFSHPALEIYRIWFLCANCRFQTRAQNAGKPAYFSEERRRPDLEARDLERLRRAVVKKMALDEF